MDSPLAKNDVLSPRFFRVPCHRTIDPPYITQVAPQPREYSDLSVHSSGELVSIMDYVKGVESVRA